MTGKGAGASRWQQGAAAARHKAQGDKRYRYRRGTRYAVRYGAVWRYVREKEARDASVNLPPPSSVSSASYLLAQQPTQYHLDQLDL